MRYKQDAVPGMSIQVGFTATKTGKFEIACAELCGAQHFRMRAFLYVEKTEQDLNNWLKQQLAEQSGD
jgi:cytochrome c oxidase subunit 2